MLRLRNAALMRSIPAARTILRQMAGWASLTRLQLKRCPPKPGRGDHRYRCVPPHPDHEVGQKLSKKAEGVEDTDRRGPDSARGPPEPSPAHLCAGNQPELETRGRHGANLDARGRADERDASAARHEGFGERDAGKEMAAGPAARDYDMGRGDRIPIAHPASRASESRTPTSASTIIIAEPP